MTYGSRHNPVLFLVLVFLLLLNGCSVSGCSGEKQILELAEETEELTEETAQSVSPEGGGAEPAENRGLSLVVHICGAVKKPGVYTLPGGSRVCDAVEAAGGFSGSAAENRINQAALLEDGIQLMILTREEADRLEAEAVRNPAPADGQTALPAQRVSGMGAGVQITGGASGGQSEEAPQGLVNINTASVEELMTLPGVGQTRAEAILAYRQAHGAFASIEDIMKVDGIKEGSFVRLKERITV